jgi:type I restriction enzyme S subunit
MALSDWRATTLAGIAMGPDGLQTGPFGSQLKASEYTMEGVPLVMPKDMSEGAIRTDTIARVPESVARRLERHRVKSGDVLFGRRGELGRCALVGESQKGWLCGTGCLRLRPSGIAVPGFLIQVFGSRRTARWLEEHAVGQTMLNLNTEILGRLPLLLPPLPEQRKIAAILSSVDDTIEKTQATVDQLDVVKKGLLGELLTQGMPGRHKEYRPSDAGMVPTTWRILPLREIAEVRTGLAKNTKRSSSGAAMELPYLRVANVQDGYLDLSEVKTIEVEASLVERYLLADGDVLFNEGGDADKVGRGTVWRSQLPRCLHQNHVFVVRPSSQILSDFLSLYGGSSRGKAFFLDAAKQTTNLASINSSQLKALPVPIPALSEQREIVATANSVMLRLKAETSTLASLRLLKTALLDSLLSGRLRVGTFGEEAA